MSTPSDRVFLLSLGRKSRVVSVNSDGGDLQTLIEGLESMPDGVAVDPINGHLYYSFMGVVRDGEDYWETDGHIERSNLDGSDRKIIVPVGAFVTGKQIQCDAKNGRIYWCDREGLKVMSCRTDGSDLTVHIRTGSTEQDRQDRRRHFRYGLVAPDFSNHTAESDSFSNERIIMQIVCQPSRRTAGSGCAAAQPLVHVSSFIGSAAFCLSCSKVHCCGALSGRQRRIEVPWRNRLPLR